MSVTRRNFLSSATVTMFAGAVCPSVFAQTRVGTGPAPAPAPAPINSDSPSFFDNISAEIFKPFIGDKFGIASNGRSLGSLTLIAVTQSPSTPQSSPKISVGGKSSAPVLETFTLQFRGSGAALPQESYTLSQLSLGSFPLFLVPGSSANSPTYTAVFNLIKP